jgi:hypothetical protein
MARSLSTSWSSRAETRRPSAASPFPWSASSCWVSSPPSTVVSHPGKDEKERRLEIGAQIGGRVVAHIPLSQTAKQMGMTEADLLDLVAQGVLEARAVRARPACSRLDS